jgi:translation initiation factor IF-3
MIKNNQKHRLNSDVRFPQVRVTGVGFDGEIMSSFEASKIAQEKEKDLILINEKSSPPIVRIDDYQKFLYDSLKKEKETRKNSKKSELKEIKLTPNIAEHDLLVKSKKAKEFLSSGDRLKVTLTMKGRQNTMKEQSQIVMYKFADLLENSGIPEALPKLEGNRFIMFIKPKKNEKSKSTL